MSARFRVRAAVLISAYLVACGGGEVDGRSSGGGAAGSSGAAGAQSVAISTAPCSDAPFVGNPYGMRCGFLVDRAGRPSFLRGVNVRADGIFDVSFDDGRAPLEPIPAFSADDANEIRDFGFDAIRLPINWSGIQPVNYDQWDDAYFARIDGAIEAARSAGLVVLLDLHQDAWTKEFGEDGAPRWALFPPPGAGDLLGGPLNDLAARRLSAIVENEFETFFSGGTVGAKVRVEFIAMAEHVAARFAGNDTVIGLEIFNEPLTDSAGLERLYVPAYAAVRAAMPTKVFVFEPFVQRNFLDKAPLGAAPLGPGTLYAPHTYKLAFDGASNNDGARMTMTKDTLRPQVINALDEAASWGAGLMVTEWGYAPDGIRASEYLTWESELHEEAMASAFFWLWKEQSQGRWGCFDYDAAHAAWTPRGAMKKVLARVRPAAVSGWPKSYAFDRATGIFTLTFTSDPTITAPSLIAVAKTLGAPTSVSCDGAPVSASLGPASTLSLDCGVADGKPHTIVVRVPPLP